MKEHFSSSGPYDLQRVRELFIDPNDPDSSNDLADLSSMSIKVMAQIYSSRGNMDEMSGDVRDFLENGSDSMNLFEITRDLLIRESGSRRFDEKFMGQIHPQGNKIGILANLVAAYMNTNTIVKEVSIAEHAMELEVTTWLAEMFGYDSEMSSGNIVSGGTTANTAALWVARKKKELELRKSPYSSQRRAKPLVLINSYAHYSIDKACDQMKMGLVKLPAKNFKTDVNALDEMLFNMSDKKRERIAAIVGVAGETETGLVDDIEALADVAEKYGIYLHIDAAYGGPFIMSDRGDLFRGIERADSIVVDPHKLLYTPYAAGAVLFKDKRDHALIQKSARYLQPSGNEGVLGDPSKRNFGFAARVEGSMGSHGVISTWATINLLGAEGITSLLNHTLNMADVAYSKIEESTVFRTVHAPELNTILVGLRSDVVDRSIRDEVMDKSRKILDLAFGYYISFNHEVDGGFGAYRYLSMHPYTTAEHVVEMFSILETLIPYVVENNDYSAEELAEFVKEDIR